MKIFLSHSSRDKALIREIRANLKYLDTWFDEDKLLIGEQLQETLKDVIQKESDFVVIFLDKSAISSEWVKRELEWAIERERELKRTFVLPILLENVWDLVEPAEFKKRLYIPCLDQNRSTVEGVAKLLGQHLFTWTAKLLEESNNELSNNKLNNLIEPNIYYNRKLIHWEPYNKKINNRFWACGTSLIPVAEKGLFSYFYKKGIEDIKIVLPNTQKEFVSHLQLHQYDGIVNTRLVYPQVQAAQNAYKKFIEDVKYFKKDPDEFIKLYGGIMFSNITIYDDDAFISFYDSKGIGELNFTLQYNKLKHISEYNIIENMFMEMWNADPDYGKTDKNSPKGTSLLIINDKEEVLLFLRDNNPKIPYPNRWDVLGGHVEQDEEPKECIIREMKEEIDFHLKNPKLFKTYNMSDRIEYTFWVKASLDIKKTSLKEGQELKWFNLNQIKKLSSEVIAFDFKPIILDFFKEKPFNKN